MDRTLKIGVIVIICSLIIGGSMIITQKQKQDSIERQTREANRLKEEEFNYQKMRDEEAKQKEQTSRLFLNACLADAKDNYWQYMELNGKGKRDTGVTASQYLWNQAEDKKKNDEDSCYRKYK